MRKNAIISWEIAMSFSTGDLHFYPKFIQVNLFCCFNQDTKRNLYIIVTNTFLVATSSQKFYISQPNSQIPRCLCGCFLLPNPGTSRKPMEMDRAEVIFVQTSKKLKMQAVRSKLLGGRWFQKKNLGTTRFPYYSHIFRDSNMGIVWEAYPKKSPQILHPIWAQGGISSGSESLFLWQILDFLRACCTFSQTTCL